jgi:CBS domain-containing protein
MAQQEQQKVRDAMKDSPTTIGPDASIADAARTMRDADVSIIAVVDDEDALIGVITDRDITIAVVAADADVNTTTVGDAMTDRPVSIGEGDRLDEAFQRMMNENVHRAPVTDDGGHVSGTISQSDASVDGEGRNVGGSGTKKS